MKIYTKTGDSGTTSLFGGQRITKGHHRIEAYGSIDELNASIGLIISALKLETPALHFRAKLERIQEELFVIGSHLSTPYHIEDIPETLPAFPIDGLEMLENDIDEMQQQLPELKHFILPSGTQAASHAHLARTICRRTEREVVRLSSEEVILPEILQYLNRLSDYLFVLSRAINHLQNEEEHQWIP